MQRGKVTLRPATPTDRRQVFDWLVRAYQNPVFCPGEPPPSWEQFAQDYLPFFFDQSRSDQGGLFIILVQGRDAGMVSYDARYSGPGETDVDIWMRSEDYCSQGWGTAALNMLCEYLHGRLGFNGFFICPSASNQRAVRAYKKCGFSIWQAGSDDQGQPGLLDCEDALIMKRTFNKSA
jgi:diamine N-acetyltransferase